MRRLTASIFKTLIIFFIIIVGYVTAVYIISMYQVNKRVESVVYPVCNNIAYNNYMTEESKDALTEVLLDLASDFSGTAHLIDGKIVCDGSGKTNNNIIAGIEFNYDEDFTATKDDGTVFTAEALENVKSSGERHCLVVRVYVNDLQFIDDISTYNTIDTVNVVNEADISAMRAKRHIDYIYPIPCVAYIKK